MNIQELKLKILDLALNGNFSETLSTDEPVECLLNKLKAKPLLDELSNYPKSWSVVSFGSLADIYTGNSTSDDEKNRFSRKIENSYEYISTKDISMSGKVDYENGMYIPKSEKKFRIAKTNSILLCIEGANAGNKIAFIDRDVCFVNKLCCFHIKEINRKFIYYYLQSRKFRNKFLDKMQGIIGGVSISKVKKLPVPIPPIEEQERIVEKLDNVFKLLEILENNQKNLVDLKAKTNNKILDLAVEGKLVKSHTSSSAIILLNDITKKQKLLISKKLIKPIKNIAPINKDELPFEIPKNWVWTRLGSIVELITDGTHKTPKYVSSGIKFISVQNISSGYFDLNNVKFITNEEHEMLCKRVKPIKNDLLICRIGTLGKAIKIDFDPEFSIFVSLGLIRFVDSRIVDFVKIFINSSYGKQWILDNRVGGGTHTYKLNLESFPNMLIPLPPVDEIELIIDKVNSLTSLVNTL